MALSLQEEELLSLAVKRYPALYDKTSKGYKEKDVAANAWEKVVESLEFAENGIASMIVFCNLDCKLHMFCYFM